MSKNEIRMPDDEMYHFLRDGKYEEFNSRIQSGEEVNLRSVNLRSIDLRSFNLEGIDFTDTYFRQADLRGLDLRKCCLEGVNIREAKVTGTYFPKELSPEEIKLSLEYGTRMRY